MTVGATFDLKRLREPFRLDHVEWRVSRAGEKSGKAWAMVIPYLNARAIQDRLDEVCGPENWCNEYTEAPGGGVLCGISIRVGGEWVTKWDGAERTDVEAVKGGLSSSLKRAAVQWGIGRYLYDVTEGFAQISDAGRFSASYPDPAHPKEKSKRKWFRWDPPTMPSWAVPVDVPGPPETVDRATGEVLPGGKAPPSPTQGRDVGPLRGRYHARLAELEPSAWRKELLREALQSAHPDLPDSSTHWTPAHYQLALNLLDAKGRGALERAVAWMRAQHGAPPELADRLSSVLEVADLSADQAERSFWIRNSGVAPWIERELDRLRVGSGQLGAPAS